jgi:hypothetical protein
MLVPVPKTAPIGGQPLRDTELLAWCGEVIQSVLADLPRVLLRTGQRAGVEGSDRRACGDIGSTITSACPDAWITPVIRCGRKDPGNSPVNSW